MVQIYITKTMGIHKKKNGVYSTNYYKDHREKILKKAADKREVERNLCLMPPDPINANRLYFYKRLWKEEDRRKKEISKINKNWLSSRKSNHRRNLGKTYDKISLKELGDIMGGD
jgi:hypothetical protein